jgi:cation diffusion facilitator CzcD-associated flavoprotein CzcO
MRDIVDRFGLRKYMKLKHEVVGAYWREEEAHWEVHVKDLLSNTTFIDYADIFVNGSGLLK